MRDGRLSTARASRTPILLLASICALASAGCGGSVVGHWRMMSSSPNRDLFALDDVRFHSDGSYSATATIDGSTQRELGMYEYNGWKLYLRPKGGGQRTFEATLKFSRLELVDRERKVSLKRE
ncbi:MAG: hypothetical protein JNG88_04690 [Phycisphaerales bacterium]|nr:hypothetical protein [Phycisphaerales bacterium]